MLDTTIMKYEVCSIGLIPLAFVLSLLSFYLLLTLYYLRGEKNVYIGGPSSSCWEGSSLLFQVRGYAHRAESGGRSLGGLENAVSSPSGSGGEPRPLKGFLAFVDSRGAG